ncbi:hypothetical protein H5410_009919 [Solanum commersonii]|uniref:Uncharacterized protein n=1 Tax=Solanum commersonii TaxID=4109 RepID=A0A9J6AJ99_SOLCO|nr:hypothetical protein H5410_009919 [Solanum commersonii]
MENYAIENRFQYGTVRSNAIKRVYNQYLLKSFPQCVLCIRVTPLTNLDIAWTLVSTLSRIEHKAFIVKPHSSEKHTNT